MTEDTHAHVSVNDHHEWLGSSSEMMEQLERALSTHNAVAILALTKSMHPADVADVIESLSSEDRHRFITLLKEQLDPEVLAHLYAEIRSDILRHMSAEEIANFLSQLNSDDAISVLQEVEREYQELVLECLHEDDKEKLKKSLTYPENSAGRLMQSEMVVMRANWTIQRAIQFLRNPKSSRFTLPDSFYEVFVVDSQYKPVGKFPLSSLFSTPERTHLKDIMDTDIHSFSVFTDQEDIAFVFKQYGLLAAPVVDHKGRLVGMVTIDDAITILEEEATEDIMRLGGVGELDFHSGILSTSFSRLRWLLVTFLDTLLASSVIYQFQSVLEKHVVLAILMPIVAAMGGNAGMQVVTVMTRALAMHNFHISRVRNVLAKEFGVAVINGLVFACLLASIAGLWFQDLSLGIILAAAMIFNIVWAGLAGTLLPILLYQFKFDPAISSGPLLTTTTDVLGFAVFLGLATLFLG